ncbi:phosphorylase superfamily protein [Streptococcus pyogenes]|nr:phosphorylase superfamily protein [Streptococcus pyogenes]VHF44200.1 phosphorylase superfamily protein [Streptococcus pyogenes]
MDWLIGYGVKEMISTGTCGVLVPIAENRFLVPVKALRDEGTSYHYVAPSRYIDIDPKMLILIEKTLLAQGLAYQEVITWSTDGFTEKPKKKWLIARKKGVRLLRWNVLP